MHASPPSESTAGDSPTSESPTSENPVSQPASTGALQRTRLAPRWLYKTLIVAMGFLALGVWGFVDAIIIYPKRGAVAAESFEHQYLGQLQASGTLTNDTATIADPVATLDRLRTKQRELSGSGSGMPPTDKARLDWLTQLRHIGRLTPAYTSFPRDDFRKNDDGSPVRVASAPERYEALKTAWSASADGKERKSQPLDWYDMPVQWVFVVVGGIVGPLMLLSVLRAKSKVYTWDAAAKRLTLPTGHTLVPADIVDVDKSKWDKFYITFKVRDGHATLSGQSVTLDLYHHVPLEDWALELEKGAS